MDTAVRAIVEAYDPHTPLSEASTPPSPWYTESRILELEQLTVFGESWQFVGRVDQLAEPGQYITGEIVGEPILVVRGNDGVLRGFYNVCRHHAATVLTLPAGKAQHLRCPYHGWTYDLQGSLVLTPELAGIARFKRAANGLVPVRIGVWNPWVFATLGSEGRSLEDDLGRDLIEQLARLNLERLQWFERRSYRLHCNWKVFVDNYLDGGYHVPHIHGGLNSVLDYSTYRIEPGERFCLQSSAMESTAGQASTAAVRRGIRAYYYWIYPNFMINVYEGVMDTNFVIPHGVDQTEVVFDYYFDDTSERARERHLASIAVSEEIQAEDAAICESVQRGLKSRAYSTGRLSVRREAGEHLFHRLLHADLVSGLDRQS